MRNLSSIFRYTVFIITMLSAIGAAGAQGVFREVITTDIPQGKTSLCALRDKFGFLWVGTTSGLACYDGNGNSVYGPSGIVPGTEGMEVSALAEVENNVWLGSSRGVYIFDRSANAVRHFDKTTRYRVPVSSQVKKILDAGDGHVWILTLGQGVFVYDTLADELSQNSRAGSFYSDAVRGRDGTIYAALLNGYLQAFTTAGNLMSSFSLPGYLPEKQNIALAQLDEDVWVSAGPAFYCYNTIFKQMEQKGNAPVNGQVNAMVSLPSDKLLCLATDDGIWAYSVADGGFTRPLEQLSATASKLPDRTISDISLDADSSLIAVTNNGGVNFLLRHATEFRLLPLPASLYSRNLILALTPEGPSRKLWVGSENGLAQYDLETSTATFPYPQLADGVSVTSFCAVDNGLWVGSRRNGLFFLSAGGVKNYVYDDNIPYSVVSNDINRIYRTKNGDVYILTSWGLCKYRPQTDNFVTLPEIDGHISFLAMAEDSNGTIWASTDINGLYMRRSDRPRFEIFNSHTLGSSAIEILYVDSKGTLWAANQSNELFYFDDKAGDFVKVALPVPPDNLITFIEDDIESNLWVGTAAGVVRIDHAKECTLYPFLSNNSITTARGASCCLSDGTIVFGDNNGLRMFDPRTIKYRKLPVAAYIRSISFPNREDDEAELRRLGLDLLLYTQESIHLPYADNTVTFHLAAMRYGSMPVTEFEYQLEGIDKGWQRTASPEVTYRNLPPGTYRLQVRPAFDEEVDPQTLEVVIGHPWYSTWIAYLVYIVAGLALILAVAFFIRRKVRGHFQRRIDAMQQQKDRETYESKMQFFTNLVHENRTPLTLISLQLEQLAENYDRESRGEHSAESRELLKGARRNVNYLMGITNQILDFRKAENDSEVRLKRSCIELDSTLRSICRRFEQPMRIMGKSIQLVLPGKPIVASLDAAKFDRIMMNLIGNAMKYAKTKVEVRLALAQAAADRFVVEVIDDGPGLDPKEIEKIFERYYQSENGMPGGFFGTGLGLAYSRMVARAHEGDISFRNAPGGGAVFTLELPVEMSESCEEVGCVAKQAESGDDSAAEQPESPAADEPARRADSSATTILIVDDNKELLAAIARGVGRKYRVVTANNGREALDLLSGDIDVAMIISDCMMPVMDGTEFCRRVKADVNLSHIPFIMLTAKTGPEAKEEGMESGADVFIEKPFTMKQLNLQIANMLRTRDVIYERMRSDAVPDTPDQPMPQAAVLNKVDADFMTALDEYIGRNIMDEEMSIDAIAERMNMSRSSFYRKIKALTGMTPVDYLKNYRLELAARMLLEGARINEVAMQTGFASSSYFAKCFRAKYGMIPKEYIANNGSAQP